MLTGSTFGLPSQFPLYCCTPVCTLYSNEDLVPPIGITEAKELLRQVWDEAKRVG